MQARVVSVLAGIGIFTIAGCGADDAFAPPKDAGVDATQTDASGTVDVGGEAPDVQEGAVAEGAADDGSDGESTDAWDAGHEDADAAVEPDARDAADSGAELDASDAADARDAERDASDAGDAADASDAEDAKVDLCQGVVCTALDQCHTAGICDPATGACSNPPVTDGAACTGDNLCFQTHTCQNGMCTPSDPVVCTATDQCHVAGSCDHATGMCSNPAATDGSPCTGSNLCFQTNTCQSGMCTGANPVVCTPMDQCHVAGSCDHGTGTCSNPAVTDGTACTSSNLCFHTNTCQNGSCTGSSPVVCSAMDQCHVAGSCDHTTGMCSNPAANDGTPCNDGKACTLTAACQTGMCTTMTSVSCSTVCGTTLSAFTGTQTSGWNINGSAAYDSGANTVVLTDGASTAEAGTVFYQDPLVADAFTIAFDFRATTIGGRADGIAFVMQTNGPTAVGAAYGGLGAMGLTGYGVELDIFDNGNCDPGNGNHASIDVLSPCASNAGIPDPAVTSADLFGLGVGDIADGAWRTATIRLASGALSVSVTDSSGTPITVPNLQSASLLGFTSGTPYYLGFAGGSGSNGLYARQEVRNVQVSFSSPHCL
jgi:hypothetical protein